MFTSQFAHCAEDKLTFGQFKGLRYLDVFKYSRNYIEWLIRDTEHFFVDLTAFFSEGLPYDFTPVGLSDSKRATVMNYLIENTTPSSAGGYRIDKASAEILINSGVITADNFIPVDYKFDELLRNKNALKIAQ